MSWQGQWAGHSTGQWFGYVVAPEVPSPAVPLAGGGLSWLPPLPRLRPAVDEIDDENLRLVVVALQ